MITPLQYQWVFICVIALLCGLTPAIYAQGVQPHQQEIREDFSDDELQKFVKATSKAQKIQQVRQQKIISAIEDEGLSVERFNQILSAQQQKGKDAGVSEQELDSFTLAMRKVLEQQEKMQSEVEETIKKEGITTDTYDQIMIAYQQNPGIQKKITKIAVEQGKK